MLVLTRKRNEEIIIDDRITISVIEVKGNRVKLGIDCPREIPVHRKEVLEDMNESAGRKSPYQLEFVGCCSC